MRSPTPTGTQKLMFLQPPRGAPMSRIVVSCLQSPEDACHPTVLPSSSSSTRLLRTLRCSMLGRDLAVPTPLGPGACSIATTPRLGARAPS